MFVDSGHIRTTLTPNIDVNGLQTMTKTNGCRGYSRDEKLGGVGGSLIANMIVAETNGRSRVNSAVLRWGRPVDEDQRHVYVQSDGGSRSCQCMSVLHCIIAEEPHRLRSFPRLFHVS